MEAVSLSRLSTALVFVALLGCGAATPKEFPGKIAYRASVFPFKDDYGSNYGVCVFGGGKVANLHADSLHPAWSPDGKRLLYYSSDNGGSWIIHTYPGLQETQRFQLPHLGRRVVWLVPDVLYYMGWWDPKEKKEGPMNLYRYHLDTGQEEQLTFFTETAYRTELTSFTVSPDQRTIYFAKYDRDETMEEEPMFKGRTSFLFRLDLATSQITRLFKGDYPRFMPDGRRLICARWELHGGHRGSSDLYYYDLETTQFTQLTNNGEGMQERESCPSPDGRYIVYKMNVFGGGEKGRALYVINADGTNERLLVGHDGNDYGDPDWGP